LMHIESLLSQRRLRVQTLVIECHQCHRHVLKRMQEKHGYNIYVLNMHIDRRFLDAQGIERYSGKQAMPSFVQELFSIRFMRHIYRLKRNMTDGEWHSANHLRREYCNQYLLTMESLLEPRREHPSAIWHPSPQRKAGKYVPPTDGVGVEK